MSFLSLKQLNMNTKNILYQWWGLARLAGIKKKSGRKRRTRGKRRREKSDTLGSSCQFGVIKFNNLRVEGAFLLKHRQNMGKPYVCTEMCIFSKLRPKHLFIAAQNNLHFWWRWWVFVAKYRKRTGQGKVGWGRTCASNEQWIVFPI